MNQFSIGKRILILTLVGAVLMMALAGIAWRNESAAVASLKTVYEDRVVPLGDLAQINLMLNENVAELLLAMQHDPEGKLAAAHNHPMELHLNNFIERRQKINELWDKYMATYLTPEEKRIAEDAVAKRKVWASKAGAILERIKGGDYSTALANDLISARQVEGRAAVAAMADLIKLQGDIAREEYEKEVSTHQTGTLIFVLIIIGGLAGNSVFAWLIIRSITGPIGTAVSVAEGIANGDLTQQVPTGGGDEAGRLLNAFARMQSSLREMVRGTQSGAHDLSSAAESLSQAASRAESASSAQSDAASSMAAAVEQVSVSIDQVRDHAREALNIAEAAGESSKNGGAVVHSSAEEMGQVAAAVNDAANTIRELENYSKEITAIINVIREVADQTNLLALNAAIEAARAGEQGRGFAVVADEVRKLAERTSESTHTIGSVIEKVQQGARRAAQEIENGVARVEGGVKMAHSAGDSITNIRNDSQRVASAVMDIGSALDEQSVAAQSIARGVENIASMAEESSSSVSQASQSARQLHDLAATLERTVARFRV